MDVVVMARVGIEVGDPSFRERWGRCRAWSGAGRSVLLVRVDLKRCQIAWPSVLHRLWLHLHGRLRARLSSGAWLGALLVRESRMSLQVRISSRSYGTCLRRRLLVRGSGPLVIRVALRSLRLHARVRWRRFLVDVHPLEIRLQRLFTGPKTNVRGFYPGSGSLLGCALGGR